MRSNWEDLANAVVLKAVEDYRKIRKQLREDPDQAPDYASHIDIDNKPGFDPMEICWRIWPPLSVPLDCSLLRGTHGRQCRVMCASTFEMDPSVHSFLGAAGTLKEMLSQ